ncbi:hypothetical protein L1887_22464 [Cichorium endivia]|nr:hypothetical protein L1887_22464 [Cichorium endivia]
MARSDREDSSFCSPDSLLKSLCDEINRINISAGSEPETLPVRAVAVQLDVSADEATIEAAVQKAWEAFGHIDALINNAGIPGKPRDTLEFEEREWNYIFRTNLTGSWLVAKHVCIRMRDAKQGGSVINISSITGTNRVLFHGGIAYASSKTAVNTMTKVMALELGTNNIRVNCINPGMFRTEITQQLLDKKWFNNVEAVLLLTLGIGVEFSQPPLSQYLFLSPSSPPARGRSDSDLQKEEPELFVDLSFLDYSFPIKNIFNCFSDEVWGLNFINAGDSAFVEAWKKVVDWEVTGGKIVYNYTGITCNDEGYVGKIDVSG